MRVRVYKCRAWVRDSLFRVCVCVCINAVHGCVIPCFVAACTCVCASARVRARTYCVCITCVLRVYTIRNKLQSFLIINKERCIP